ncbi:MAG: glycoside hydrolase family 32 protein [Anaerolineaceae bacterium]|nr:glycoside hydrolase family 32 protein [Anaerolineaceae bacterium]
MRKLFMPGSYKKLEDGFTFQLNNTLMAVTVIGIQILTDGKLIPTEQVTLQFQGQEVLPAAHITAESPLILSMALPLSVRAVVAENSVKKLTISAQTLELGELSFSMDLQPKRANPFLVAARMVKDKFLSIALVRKVARDPLHPIYHFSPPANFLNDPNGLLSWQGETHLFYQYNPNAPVWGSPHWGHAVSKDMVFWHRLPIAMSPRAGTPNADGCWSGSATVTEEGPVFVYTAVFPETVCLARPDKAFRKLVPVGEEPLISAPPVAMKVEGFRDPNLWQEDDKWYISFGSGIKDVGGALLLFESYDRIHWHYLHPLLLCDLHQTEPFPTGFMWECPQMFEIEGEYFIFLSGIVEPGHQYTYYFQGSYQNLRFTPKTQQFMDYGASVYYAPLSFVDDQSRRIQLGWLVEERQEEAFRKAGWAGVMSLPRWLRLSKERTLLVEPIPELDRLHADTLLSFEGSLPAIDRPICSRKPVINAEIRAKLRSAGEGKVSFLLAESPTAVEKTLLEYDFEAGLLSVDSCASSIDPLCKGELKQAPLKLNKGETLDLQVFVDGSVLEIFANQRGVLSSRYYPSQIQKNRLFIKGSDEASVTGEIKVWKMRGCIV